MRRAPCETQHDVTFSRSYDQGKFTKKNYKDNYLLSSFQPKGVSHVYELDCSGIRREVVQTVFAVVSCAVSRAE